jgi:hypothetical protein
LRIGKSVEQAAPGSLAPCRHTINYPVLTTWSSPQLRTELDLDRRTNLAAAEHAAARYALISLRLARDANRIRCEGLGLGCSPGCNRLADASDPESESVRMAFAAAMSA